MVPIASDKGFASPVSHAIKKDGIHNAAIVHVDISNFDCKLDLCFAIRI